MTYTVRSAFHISLHNLILLLVLVRAAVPLGVKSVGSAAWTSVVKSQR